MTLGKIIEQTRKANPRFRTKKSLADACGVSLEYIRKIEADQGKPSGRLLEVIIEQLEMSQKDARTCWGLLAELQIDDVTKQHVKIAETRGRPVMNGIATRAAKIAVEWLEDYYGVSPEDAEILEEEILNNLRK